ncbi:MAG: cell envelope integrity protein TolA [Pseudomonadota bacterium]
MNSATSHYLIPAEPGRGRALALAVLVHFLLLIFLWFGVSWQSDTPTEVEAEIWSPVAREAAPPPPSPVDKPIQEPPKPVAAITPPTPPAPVVQPEPAQQKLAEPDIALEKEKKRKQEKEDAERLKKEKLAEKKALEDEQKRKKISDAEEKQNEKKKQAELEKIKRTEDKKQKEEAAAEEKKKLAEEQQRKQEEAAAAEQRARKRREEIQRLNQMAGDGGAGDAEKSQGPRGDNSYARKVAGLIKSHTILPQNDIAGNPAVEFLIELQPDGGLRNEPKMTKSSGIAAFDQAVKRAIEKSAPFPPDPSTGKVPASINITHRLKDSDTR